MKRKVITITEGKVCKGGRNPPNTSGKRPKAPKGSGGKSVISLCAHRGS